MRTDPGGSASAQVVILGLYPSETRSRVVRIGREQLRLPAAVEQNSFEGSASGKELRDRVLNPLRLEGDDVYLLDSYPYYLASDKGQGGSSMWSNVQTWRKHTGETDDVQRRPEPAAMPQACRDLPGNLERLADQFAKCRSTLLLTLGAEVAAFVRDCGLADGQRALYGRSERRTVFGLALDVVHLAHPGILMSALCAQWRAKHEAWCANEGVALVTQHLKRA